MKFYDANKDYDEIGTVNHYFHHRSCLPGSRHDNAESLFVTDVHDPGLRPHPHNSCSVCGQGFNPVTEVPNDNTFSPF